MPAHPDVSIPGLPEGLRDRQPLLWLNPRYQPDLGPGRDPEPATAEARYARCAGLLARVFPELAPSGGRLSSALMPLARCRDSLGLPDRSGSGFLKRDDSLPVAGSVKARGGFHEVLAFVEGVAGDAGLLRDGSDRVVLAEPEARARLGRYTISVGSTGNLGLAIGLIGAGLGLRCVVHMSADAKAWKKQRLRERGIEVVEHAGDYAMAVAAGRAAAAADPRTHFVDDERSLALFLGYAAAARELQAQLHAAGRPVDPKHPLFVYLPCGVGGAPGGILHGLKRLYGASVHGFVAEPVAAPCMLVQLVAGCDTPVSVYDAGLDGRTEADGLAVAQASSLVAPLMARELAGVFTVTDDSLFRAALQLEDAAQVYVEPSAAAGLGGPVWLLETAAGQHWLQRHGLEHVIDQATHVIWSTGGSLVPESIRASFRARGRRL